MYRERFDQMLPDEMMNDIRLALNQTQPLGNSQFSDAIEQAAGQRREAKPRDRPRKPAQDAAPGNSRNLNALLDDQLRDPLSGNAVLGGVATTMRAVELG